VVGFYFGLAPILAMLRRERDEAFVRHHFAQALAILGSFMLLALLGFLASVVWAWVIITQRQIIERLPFGSDVVILACVLFVMALIWLAGIGLALAGSMRPLPGIARLAARPRLVRGAFLGHIAFLVLAGVVTGMTLHARSLTQNEDQPAPVYVLYDDMRVVPRWVFQLGVYRIALTATDRWGPGSVVVQPLTHDHLKRALAHGQFVLLLTHGRDGQLTLGNLLIAAPIHYESITNNQQPCIYTMVNPSFTGEWKPVPVGRLEFVYLAACDAGRAGPDWRAALAPAEVVAHDRLTAVLEHVWWLWIDAPARFRQ
jgi:hypothetical protein